MLKILGCVIVLASSFGLGIFYYRQEQWHLISLRRLYQCILQLQGEICYHLTTLPEAFCNVGRKQENEIGDWWRDVGLLLDTGEEQLVEVISGTMSTLQDVGHFQGEDMQILRELMRSLGYLDVTMQERGLTLSLQRLEDVIQRAETATREKKKLYTMLGILGGCFLVIILL